MFVDDDRALLEGMRDALRPRRHEWAMSFVDSGTAALAELKARPCDVVVSDLRMPGMDGASLLAAVAEHQPDAIRIVLSGHASVDTVVRAAAVAHRLVAKPCEAGDLTRIIERACVLHDIADRVELRRTATGAAELPCAPRVYTRLTRLLADPEAGADEAAEIVAQDIAMSARLLQMANSAFFRRRSEIVCVRQAVALVGLNTLRALALATSVYAQLGNGGDGPVPGFSVDELQQRSAQVARVARLVRGHTSDVDDAFSAGLLLDVGLLVLSKQEPARLQDLIATATAEGCTLGAVERARGVVTHAEIGAHLLALWGVPHSIVEAVAHHADPTAIPSPSSTRRRRRISPTRSSTRFIRTSCWVMAGSRCLKATTSTGWVSVIDSMDGCGRLPMSSAPTEREPDIAGAFAPGALAMHYQPVVELQSGAVVGFEALARFAFDPYRPPDVWFAAAERVGRGVELELLAIHEVVESFARLPPDCFVSINASPAAVLAPGLVDTLVQLPLARVILEVTEQAPIASYERFMAALRPLRECGLRLAIDDLGAGFAGLNHVLALEPDLIKLDRQITARIHGHHKTRALAAALTSFATETGVTVLAEGIETEAQRAVLTALGVSLGQGYLLGRPAPLCRTAASMAALQGAAAA